MLLSHPLRGESWGYTGLEGEAPRHLCSLKGTGPGRTPS